MNLTEQQRKVLARLGLDGRTTQCSTHWIGIGLKPWATPRRVRQVLQGLERRGLVEAQTSTAGYRYWWKLTDAGIAANTTQEPRP